MSDDLHALAAAYALDALDPLERRRFEAHYPDCPSCRDEVAGFRETASRLPATTPAPLPADLKDKVMSEVSATRQLPPRVAPTSTRSRPALISLAAAVVVVALVGVAIAVGRSNGPDTAQELAEVLAAPDAVTVELDGDTGATLRVVYSETQERAVVVGSALDAAPGDDTYQLWAINGTEPASAGVFRPGGDGTVESSVTAPGVPPDAWAVTVEPDGGSPAPTGDILYQGTSA